MKQQEENTGTQKEFLDRFRKLACSKSDWQVWSDLVTAWACGISNTTLRIIGDTGSRIFQEREQEYERCIKNIGDKSAAGEMLAVMIEAFEKNPEQDFLGEMYMKLELGSHWHGQFFTPYHVAAMMSEADFAETDIRQRIQKDGYISINDPACGAGATLIGAAGTLRKMKVNYQESVLFTGNDIDRTTAMMCYVQLSLLGCPGWVAITDTLTRPISGEPIMPDENEGQEFWYTPFFFTDVWTKRRMINALKRTEMHGQ